MEKLNINLDDDFKNIDTNITSSITDTIGIDLLINKAGSGSPKSDQGYNSDGNKSEEARSDHSFFKNDEPQSEEKKISIDPINDPIMNNIASEEYKPVHILSQTDIKNEKIDLLYKFKK